MGNHQRPTPGLVGVAATLVLAVAIPSSAEVSKRRLREAIDRVVERPVLAHAFWGIVVRDLDRGTILYEHNADKAFRPASTMKLVTTAAALDAIPPDARVRTTVETAGRRDGLGRVLGDVYLVGRGDASLSSRFEDEDVPATRALEALADALVAAGIGRIEGRLVGQEGAFTGDRRGADWMAEDLTWGYGAEVSALSFNDNVVRVKLLPGERPGDPAVLDVVPRTAFVPVEEAVVTAAAGTERDVTLVKPLGSNHVRLSGVLPQGGEWEGEVAVEDPALFTTTVFAEVLSWRGVSVAGGLATSSDPLPRGTTVLAVHEGEPLARLVEEINKESQNLHAELLLRRLGLAVFGEGTREKGHEAVELFLDRLAAPRSGWGLKDGSGLSHTNVVTPRGLSALLVAMDRHPRGAVFRSSLPVAGVDGTLEERMRGTPAKGRVVAKTGTLQGVNALAGYVTTVRGDRLAFALFVNNHFDLSDEAKAALDAIAVALSTAH
jgi:D-alanyl-D-alanine carboxypeptidase/D-alanyl-D-alanine-endopeptidase (penicillin-binding protein 4)